MTDQIKNHYEQVKTTIDDDFLSSAEEISLIESIETQFNSDAKAVIEFFDNTENTFDVSGLGIIGLEGQMLLRDIIHTFAAETNYSRQSGQALLSGLGKKLFNHPFASLLQLYQKAKIRAYGFEKTHIPVSYGNYNGNGEEFSARKPSRYKIDGKYGEQSYLMGQLCYACDKLKESLPDGLELNQVIADIDFGIDGENKDFPIKIKIKTDGLPADFAGIDITTLSNAGIQLIATDPTQYTRITTDMKTYNVADGAIVILDDEGNTMTPTEYFTDSRPPDPARRSNRAQHRENTGENTNNETIETLTIASINQTQNVPIFNAEQITNTLTQIGLNIEGSDRISTIQNLYTNRQKSIFEVGSEETFANHKEVSQALIQSCENIPNRTMRIYQLSKAIDPGTTERIDDEDTQLTMRTKRLTTIENIPSLKELLNEIEQTFTKDTPGYRSWVRDIHQEAKEQDSISLIEEKMKTDNPTELALLISTQKEGSQGYEDRPEFINTAIIESIKSEYAYANEPTSINELLNRVAEDKQKLKTRYQTRGDQAIITEDSRSIRNYIDDYGSSIIKQYVDSSGENINPEDLILAYEHTNIAEIEEKWKSYIEEKFKQKITESGITDLNLQNIEKLNNCFTEISEEYPQDQYPKTFVLLLNQYAQNIGTIITYIQELPTTTTTKSFKFTELQSLFTQIDYPDVVAKNEEVDAKVQEIFHAYYQEAKTQSYLNGIQRDSEATYNILENSVILFGCDCRSLNKEDYSYDRIKNNPDITEKSMLLLTTMTAYLKEKHPGTQFIPLMKNIIQNSYDPAVENFVSIDISGIPGMSGKAQEYVSYLNSILQEQS